MAKANKQPVTQEEGRAYRAAHPERGMIEGDPAVRFDSVDMRGMVPRELEREALLCGGAHGYSKAEIIRAAIAAWVGDPRTQAVKDSFVRRKMSQYNLTEYQVYAKVLGAYKRTTRDRRVNLAETSQDS